MHRYRIQALRTASDRNLARVDSNGAILPQYNAAKDTKNHEAGGLSNRGGGGGAPHARPPPQSTQDGGQHGHGLDGSRDHRRDAEKAAHNDEADAISQTTPPPAPPPLKSEDASAGNTAMTDSDVNNKDKPPMTTRMNNGSKRFAKHFKNAICHSWINVLLIAVPAGIAAEAAGLQPAVIFAINAVAIVPLAGMLAHATESVASRLGDTLGALLNVSFGNAVELIIFIIALVKNEIRIVQASILGSILANLLLILGMAFVLGGLRYREQVYNSTVTQMSACCLSLSVMSLLLPTAFHASFNEENVAAADNAVLKVSRGTSVILLIIYILYLLFQLKSHAYMYESTPQAIIDEESHPGVLHDMMNSSSSDSSSSSSSSDSGSSASGSVANTTKRMKRMFKHKKRRKSSASTSTTQTASGLPSIISSPSTENPTTDYFREASRPVSRRGSGLAAIASGDEADADKEDNGISRVFDWAKRHNSHDRSKSPDANKKRKNKHHKKKDKKRCEHGKEKVESEKAETAEEPTEAAANQTRVAFDNNVQIAEDQPVTETSPSKTGLNMRQLSSRAFRPALPTYLSNTVFSRQYDPQAALISTAPMRPVGPVRAQSEGHLRRTNSLPDRLNRQATPASIQHTNSGPLPPYPAPPSPNDEDGDGEVMSRTAAVVLLLFSTALVAACAEFMVDAIPLMIKNSPSVGEAFIGLIILPIVGNAAEHVTAVTVATKNKMDLALGIALGSSIQIALFVTPLVVLLGWILNKDMTLYFNLFETVSLFATAFVLNFLILDGRSNYLEGSLLVAAYVIIALVAFFYPDSDSLSQAGGGETRIS